MTIIYDSSIVKRNKDGAVLISDRLEKGERLIDGSTYRDEEVRLGRVNTPSPFAQGSMIENNNPDNPAPGLTTEDGINTIRQGDDITKTGEKGEEQKETSHILTVTDDGNSTQVVTPNEELRERETPTSTQTEYVDPPKDSDSKREWYDYAVKAKGHTGEYDDLTKSELIEKFGQS